MSLAEHARGATGVAYSRLWRHDMPELLHSLSLPLIEVPHVRGVPIPIDLPDGFVHVVEWPNAAGVLEPAHAEAVISWDPELAPVPRQALYVAVSDAPQAADIERRTAFLTSLTSRLAQLPGVVAPIRPDAPTTILLTHGVPDESLESVNRSFPGSIQRVRRELGEFPGGLQLVITDDVWALPEEYAETLEHALQGKGLV
ncbi:MAG: hypothetical protein ABFR95_03610 [Actinomycetota bacterium]